MRGPADPFRVHACPAGPSWRAAYLGLGLAQILPIFLRFAQLVVALADLRKGAAYFSSPGGRIEGAPLAIDTVR